MPSSLKRDLLLLSVLLFAIAAAYLNTVNNPFIYDDEQLIVHNKRMQELNVGIIKAAFTDRSIYNMAIGEIYRPLQFLLLSAEYRFFGLNPGMFHVVNILLHFLSAAVLYLLIKTLTNEHNLAFVTALIFSLHPVNTEAVAWIKGNDSILCSIFYILSLTAYITWSRNGHSFLNTSYLTSCLFFIFAMFSKETAVTLPAVILAYEYIINKNRQNILINIIPFALFMAAYLYIRTSVLGQIGQESSYFGKGILENTATSLSVIFFYLQMLALPFNQNADYFNFPISKYIFSPVIFFSVTTILFFLNMGRLTRHKTPIVAFFTAWFFITILPIINIIPIKILIAERFMYIPAAGIIGLLSYSLLSLRNKRVCYSLILLIVIFFGSLTVLRNEVWSSSYAFWTDALKKDQDNARAHANLAMLYMDRRETDRARDHFLKSVDSLRLSSNSFIRLGYKFKEAGEMELAVRAFKRASFDRTLLSVHSNIGLIHQSQGRFDEAIDEFKKELDLNPNDMVSLVNLGVIYGIEKKCNEADFFFRKALALNPGDKKAFLGYNSIMNENCR